MPRRKRTDLHKDWQCPVCKWVYRSPVAVVSVQCWGGSDVGKHSGRDMKPLEVA